MATIKNKTSLRVGDNVYHPDLGVYHVTEITPLNNRVVYVKIEQQRNNYTSKSECTMLNSKLTRVLTELYDTSNSYCTFYLHDKDSRQARAFQDENDKYRMLGCNVWQLRNMLK